LPSNHPISEPIQISPKAITARCVAIGGCAVATRTASTGTTDSSVKASGAVIATKIDTGAVLDTAMGAAGVIGTALAGMTGKLVKTRGAGITTKIGIVWTEVEIIVATMEIGLCGA
jgi:hypothetical protein